jgi:hypothetical protein
MRTPFAANNITGKNVVNLAILKLAERLHRKDVLTFAQTMHNRWLGKRLDFVAPPTTVAFILKLLLQKKKCNRKGNDVRETCGVCQFYKIKTIKFKNVHCGF